MVEKNCGTEPEFLNKIFTKNEFLDSKSNDSDVEERVISKSRMKIDYKKVEKDLKV